MAVDLERLVVTLEAQNTQYLRKLDQSNKKLDRFRKDTKRNLQGVSSDFKRILGAVAVAGFVNKIISATREQEDAVRQLEQGLATTGGVVGRSLEELTQKAQELQKATTFGDEEIIRAQSQLVSFASITGDAFERTTELALDLSTRFNLDLRSSVLQLGKALNDPVKNLSALSRAGIQFSDEQIDMIKGLVKSNRLLDAQNIILKELEVQFGGSARAARETFGGAIDALQNTVGDLLEADDGLPGATKAINDLNDSLSDPAIKASIDAITEGVIKITASIAGALPKIISFGKFIGEAFAKNKLISEYTEELEVVNKKIADFDRQLNSSKGLPGALWQEDEETRQRRKEIILVGS